MSDRTRVTLEFLVVLGIALLFTAAPGGDSTLQVILAILSIGFFVAIALFGYRLYRENKFTVDSLTDLQRGVLYSIQAKVDPGKDGTRRVMVRAANSAIRATPR